MIANLEQPRLVLLLLSFLPIRILTYHLKDMSRFVDSAPWAVQACYKLTRSSDFARIPLTSHSHPMLPMPCNKSSSLPSFLLLTFSCVLDQVLQPSSSKSGQYSEGPTRESPSLFQNITGSVETHPSGLLVVSNLAINHAVRQTRWRENRCW